MSKQCPLCTPVESLVKSFDSSVIALYRGYRARNKGKHILLSNSQVGPGRTVKQEQEEISRNHVQTFIPGSVHIGILADAWADVEIDFFALGCVT